jgi:hypothetical protein
LILAAQMAVAKQRKSDSAVAGRLSRAATYEKPATSGARRLGKNAVIYLPHDGVAHNNISGKPPCGFDPHHPSTSAAILDRLSAFEASLDPVIDVAHLPALLVQRDED